MLKKRKAWFTNLFAQVSYIWIIPNHFLRPVFPIPEGTIKFLLFTVFTSIFSFIPAGPILPSSLHAITTLLRPSQKGNFSATLYTHAPTAVMNMHTKQQVTFASSDLELQPHVSTHTGRGFTHFTFWMKRVCGSRGHSLQLSLCLQCPGSSVDLSGCGLHPASIQQLQQSSSLGKTALTHINMKNYSYTWRNWRVGDSVCFWNYHSSKN